MQRISRAPNDVLLAVRIELKQQNLEHGARFVQDISDPTSPNFGKHWTAEQVNKKFAPLPVTINTTLDWVHAAGIEKSRIKLSAGNTRIKFSATVGEVEKLLQTEYHMFQDNQSGEHHIGADGYELPQHVSEHVNIITPTTELVGLHPVARAATVTTNLAAYDNASALGGPDDLSDCLSLFTIHCLRAMYNVPVASHNNTGNELGIAAFKDSLYYPDLPAFFKNYTSPQVPLDVEPEFISIGGGKPGNLSQAIARDVTETALDVQTAYSIIYPQQVRLYTTGDSEGVQTVGGFNAIQDALDPSHCPSPGDNRQGEGNTDDLQCGGAPVSNVISFSYVIDEAALPLSHARHQCQEWMKLALQGVSVIVGSGDTGVGSGLGKDVCMNDEGSLVWANGAHFSPMLPGGCPYVTVVGGTRMCNRTIAGGEKAIYFSGGGFSNIFPRPGYQDDAVLNYLDNFAPVYGQEVYNRSGRAYPDVSANALNMPVVVLNTTRPQSGTSASAPIFASIVNLLNEERLKAGKGPVGFLNPIIYKYPEMFNDIVEGSNPGCGTNGFPASPGWDPATGLGTPRYDKMREVFLALP
ncbi:peptidase S8/S53 domain-containing protein [Alternaria rosae]|uniref:peptidase S8/S53 domain-containing protein n=1 Tax=Alternaria rosae TaxID=1187941 RepID=UPI001E8EB8CF|nr:peptidase S8/S53 domain-containing protein [Alternaria rosae]KAH6868439.1 peptidase S8/S53 domain-containing protein [Alternaria rosae]